MKNFFKTYGFILALIAILTIIAEMIGTLDIPLPNNRGKIVFLPMLHAVIFSMILLTVGIKWLPRLRARITKSFVTNASFIFGVAMLPLSLKLGITVGSQFDTMLEAGPALLIQQLGNFGTLLLGFPIALALGLKRETVGATVSICREGTIGVISEKYPAGSPEVIGTLAIYIIGSVLGTIIFSLIGSLSILTGLHPYALAMGAGIGSASMLTAAIGPLVDQVDPSMQEKVLAFGATSNLLSSFMEAYIVLFITLPLANWLYKKTHPQG